MENRDLRKIFGYSLMVLSVLLWLGIFLTPLLELPKTQISGVTTFLIISGEAAFYLSIVLLGKEVWQKIKNIFSRKKIDNE
jgi:hypothetical protein